MLSDGYEMRETHRAILAKNRLYLLHNLRPTEAFWGTLLEKDLLSQDMLDEIKGIRIISEQIGRLLDILPARGPTAFESFCEALLQCDHAHAGEYLKNMEAVEQFREEIEPHCSDYLMERYVNIFKRSVPSAQRYIERKFEMILEEQDRELQEKETELKRLDGENTRMILELTQLKSFAMNCTDSSDRLSTELEKKHKLSKDFIENEERQMERSREQFKDVKVLEKLCKYFDNVLVLLHYLKSVEELKLHAVKLDTSRSSDIVKREEFTNAPPKDKKGSLHATSLQDRMQQIIANIGQTMQKVSSAAAKAELELVTDSLKTVNSDIVRVKDTLKRTMRQKRVLEGELVSLLHSLQEVRRLEREAKEKQSHITELNNQGQVMKKKSKHSKKLLDDIKLSIEQRKVQLMEIQQTLQRRLGSADQRMHNLLDLLPDLEDNDLNRADTELSINTSTLSRSISPTLSINQTIIVNNNGSNNNSLSKPTMDSSSNHRTALLYKRRLEEQEEENLSTNELATALVITAQKAQQFSESKDTGLIKADSQKNVRPTIIDKRTSDVKKPIESKGLIAKKPLDQRRLSLSQTNNQIARMRKDDNKNAMSIAEKVDNQPAAENLTKPAPGNAPMSIIDRWLEKEKQNAPTYNKLLVDRMGRLQNIGPMKESVTPLTTATAAAAATLAVSMTTTAASMATAVQSNHPVQICSQTEQKPTEKFEKEESVNTFNQTNHNLNKTPEHHQKLSHQVSGSGSANSTSSSEKENRLPSFKSRSGDSDNAALDNEGANDILIATGAAIFNADGYQGQDNVENDGSIPAAKTFASERRTRDKTASTVKISLDTGLSQGASQLSYGVVNNIMAARKLQEQQMQREQLKASRVDLRLPNS